MNLRKWTPVYIKSLDVPSLLCTHVDLDSGCLLHRPPLPSCFPRPPPLAPARLFAAAAQGSLPSIHQFFPTHLCPEPIHPTQHCEIRLSAHCTHQSDQVSPHKILTTSNNCELTEQASAHSESEYILPLLAWNIFTHIFFFFPFPFPPLTWDFPSHPQCPNLPDCPRPFPIQDARCDCHYHQHY